MPLIRSWVLEGSYLFFSFKCYSDVGSNGKIERNMRIKWVELLSAFSNIRFEKFPLISVKHKGY